MTDDGWEQGGAGILKRLESTTDPDLPGGFVQVIWRSSDSERNRATVIVELGDYQLYHSASLAEEGAQPNALALVDALRAAILHYEGL